MRASHVSVSRRELLAFGSVVLSCGWLPELAWGAERASGRGRGRAQACIQLYMDGGASHIDLWDLKPEAPPEIRGPFQPIATTVPGVQVCEHLPLVAKQMHHLAQVRSIQHAETVHDPAVYHMLTGRKHPAPAGGLQVQPNDAPHLGALFAKADARPAIAPKWFELPETMRINGRILPGQNAGFLGKVHDPFRIEVTADLQVIPPDLQVRAPLTPARLGQRGSLLQQLNAKISTFQHCAEAGELDRVQRQALALLSRAQVQKAFDLDQEPAAVRDAYGRCRQGQSVLLARRLVEAGVRFVTVYWGREVQDWADGKIPQVANNPWDTHRNHFPLLKSDLLPRADRCLAALLDDLHQRGLLSQTLVVWMTDFGRTPQITRPWASRDHWPHANTALLAGAGVTGGAVHGRTDRHAAYVTDTPLSPADLTATIFHALGIDPETTVHDRQGRPFALSDGTPLRALWT